LPIPTKIFYWLPYYIRVLNYLIMQTSFLMVIHYNHLLPIINHFCKVHRFSNVYQIQNVFSGNKTPKANRGFKKLAQSCYPYLPLLPLHSHQHRFSHKVLTSHLQMIFFCAKMYWQSISTTLTTKHL
jgi:hypothetical protein